MEWNELSLTWRYNLSYTLEKTKEMRHEDVEDCRIHF